MAAGHGGGAAAAPGREERGQVSFLDQALWRQLHDADSAEVFARAWLLLQCRIIEGVNGGAVILGEPERGPFEPVAAFPHTSSPAPSLLSAAQRALAERRGIAHAPRAEAGRPGAQPCVLAHPILVGGQLFGAVALELSADAVARLHGVMRQLQWGASGLEFMLYRRRSEGARQVHTRVDLTLGLVASAVGEERFAPACNAVVTELATRLGCDRVSVGFLRRGRAVVAALSNTAQFGKRMNLIRVIGNAMDEAIDQRAIVLWPPDPDGEPVLSLAHEVLDRSFLSDNILTVPIHAGARMLGALTLERSGARGFTTDEIDLIECVAGAVGPVLEDKRRNDRLILAKIGESATTQVGRVLGPRYYGRKLALLLAAVVVAFFAVAKDTYRVTAPAILEGSVQRSIVAALDGYLEAEHARAGDIVQAGQLLAELDDRDLELERVRLGAELGELRWEYGRALAEGERALVNISRVRMAQVEAMLELADEHIARTRIRAPFAGVIVAGDLSQSVGAAVQRGQDLFKIAPLEDYRIILRVDESQITDIAVGQNGTLVVASLPDEPLPVTVERITPVAEALEGRTHFRVEARLDTMTERLRPGMEGVAKIAVDERRLIWIWTRGLIDWIRLTLWRWWP